jgi:hypothetical protein
MRDTPRTDTVLVAWDLTPEPKVLIEHARQLERELNAANEHIKRLETAGDKMVNEGWNEPHLAGLWRQAKEAKP